MSEVVKGKMKFIRGNNSSSYALLILFTILPLSSLWTQTTGSIKGLTTDPQGIALSQAPVSLIHRGHVLGPAPTGMDGRSHLPPVAPGPYDVKFEAAGLRPETRSVSVRAGVDSETASTGIKVPPYFAPSVAYDQGETVAMFIQVGRNLVPTILPPIAREGK